jgi:hypothetical protein
MIKRGKKDGQFYLIAAIIISVIVIGVVGVSNYARGQETAKSIEDMGDELKIESEKVLDYGTYNRYSDAQIMDLMENFSENYINSVQGGIDFCFLFGTSSSIRIVAHFQSDTTIYLNTGAGESPISLTGGQTESEDFSPTSTNATITIQETDYSFELKEGKNFYFVVSQDIGGEKHVAKN